MTYTLQKGKVMEDGIKNTYNCFASHSSSCCLQLKSEKQKLGVFFFKRTSHMKAGKPSYLTDAWLPDDVELFEDKGVGLSANVLLDDGNGSVCEWNCWVISLLAPLVESLCIVWLCFREDSLDTAWLDTLGGGAGTGFDFPAGNRSWRLLMQLAIVDWKKCYLRYPQQLRIFMII